jgi:hypothetical protein
MRSTGFIVTAALAIAISAPAQAAWKEFTYNDLGIRKDFPLEPKRTTGLYKTRIVDNAKADILTAEQNGVIYRLTVVDLRSRAQDGATIMGECNYNSLTQAAKALGDYSTEIGLGPNGVYGRWTSVDMANKDRVMTACYFTKGRLYKIESVITPRHEFHPNSPEAFRFVNALDFNMDPNRDVPRPAAPGAAARTGPAPGPAGEGKAVPAPGIR